MIQVQFLFVRSAQAPRQALADGAEGGNLEMAMAEEALAKRAVCLFFILPR